MVLRRNAPNSFQSYPALLSLQPQVLRIKAFDTASDAVLFLPLSALLKIKALKANTAQQRNPLLMNPSTWLYISIGGSLMHVCKWGWGEKTSSGINSWTYGQALFIKQTIAVAVAALPFESAANSLSANSAATMGARLGVFLPGGTRRGGRKGCLI